MASTSRYFTSPTTPPEEMDIDNPNPAEQIQPLNTDPRRQMKLDFSTGRMTAKPPSRNPIKRGDPRRLALSAVADETLSLLPGLLATRPDITCRSYLSQNLPLDATFNPRKPPVTVRVVNKDTIDTALSLRPVHSSSSSTDKRKPVAILNLASEISPGGGWRKGALAQEEALCYRSSLAVTLPRKFYPIPAEAAVYSPTVMVIRESYASGHGLLDFRDPRKLAVLAVVSCAAVRDPSTVVGADGEKVYALQSDKKLMVEKMRVILRTTIRNRHREVVLGALGCGAFGNPNVEVADMWKSVLLEPEFAGGWWDSVVFAVLGSDRMGNNFKVFYDSLDGLQLH